MAWTLRQGGTSPRWVKWVDLQSCRNHLSLLQLEASRFAATEASTYALKQWHCRLLFTSIAGLAISYDVDPLDAAPYAPARLNRDGGTDDLPGLYTEAATWRAEVWRVLQATSPELREHLAAGGDVQLNLYPRMDLGAGPDRGLVEYTDTPHTAEGPGDLTRANGSDPWLHMGWREWYPGLLEASHTAHIAVLLPMQWSWDLAKHCTEVILRLGLADTISLTTLYIALRNTSVARAVGGRGVPADIVNAAAAFELASLSDGQPTAGQRAFGTAAQGVARAAGGPAASTVLGLILGIPGLLQALFGTAAVSASDVWGRRQPFVARADWRGTILNPQQAPSVAPPLPMLTVVDSSGSSANLEAAQPLIVRPRASKGVGVVGAGLGAAALWYFLG